MEVWVEIKTSTGVLYLVVFGEHRKLCVWTGDVMSLYFGTHRPTHSSRTFFNFQFDYGWQLNMWNSTHMYCCGSASTYRYVEAFYDIVHLTNRDNMVVQWLGLLRPHSRKVTVEFVLHMWGISSGTQLSSHSTKTLRLTRTLNCPQDWEKMGWWPVLGVDRLLYLHLCAGADPCDTRGCQFVGVIDGWL